GREAHVGVRRPGVAVDAAVLAAAVGIDRRRKAHVGAVVAGDDHLGLLGRDGGGQLLRRVVVRLPAVVEGLAHLAFVPAGDVGAGAASAYLLGEGVHAQTLVACIEQNKNA